MSSAHEVELERLRKIGRLMEKDPRVRAVFDEAIGGGARPACTTRRKPKRETEKRDVHRA